ncbi:MAG: hypothetical protein KUL77_12090 [Thermomonas sp.]|uniref:hypothetical protein n=1 Tax=Thermomonas sp. TaxID=1971895 RepID=UPI001ED309D3|nr:hypothetical protein [Thermomonas sp.]MBV2210288.1 hypothetical protein [Thermomonas sp.]
MIGYCREANLFTRRELGAVCAHAAALCNLRAISCASQRDIDDAARVELWAGILCAALEERASMGAH